MEWLHLKRSQKIREINFNHTFYSTQSFQNTIPTCNSYFKNSTEIVYSSLSLSASKTPEYFMLRVLCHFESSVTHVAVAHAGCCGPGLGFYGGLSPSWKRCS